MNYYCVTNKAGNPCRVFAETEEQAIEIAFQVRHARSTKNLKAKFIESKPDDWYPGCAYKTLDDQLWHSVIKGEDGKFLHRIQPNQVPVYDPLPSLESMIQPR